MKFSIIILYYNRCELLIQLVNHLAKIGRDDVEIVVVDNNSKIDLSSNTAIISNNIRYIRLNNNMGAVARNFGIKEASGNFIICLDDDILGISNDNLIEIEEAFKNKIIAAVCFKVVNPVDGSLTNWSHHYDERKFSNIEFETNEISEGAVVFRRSVLDTVGLYFEKYFISHEGPDLACRILDSGSKIVYSPKIIVEHNHSDIGRKSWRRYYFDTRNLIWLNVRHYPATMAIKRILFGLCPMLIYSVRDGFVFYWLKGVKDALVGLKEVVAGRKVISLCTIEYIKKIESNRPTLIVIIKKRFFRKDVRI